MWAEIERIWTDDGWSSCIDGKSAEVWHWDEESTWSTCCRVEVLRKEAFDQKNAIVALEAERDALRQTTVEDKELKEEMGKAIILEHTRGFKKALRQVYHLFHISTEGVKFNPRKDVYQGQLVSIRDIPEGAFLGDEPTEAGNKGGVVVETTTSREVRGEYPVAPSTTVADVVNIW